MHSLPCPLFYGINKNILVPFAKLYFLRFEPFWKWKMYCGNGRSLFMFIIFDPIIFHVGAYIKSNDILFLKISRSFAIASCMYQGFVQHLCSYLFHEMNGVWFISCPWLRRRKQEICLSFPWYLNLGLKRWAIFSYFL